MNNSSDTCPVCGGHKVAGTTTFTADLGSGVVVVRNVHATVCAQCGEEWVDNETARKLEIIADEARKKRLLVEITAAVATVQRRVGEGGSPYESPKGSEIRNPKHETRNNDQMFEGENSKRLCFDHSVL